MVEDNERSTDERAILSLEELTVMNAVTLNGGRSFIVRDSEKGTGYIYFPVKDVGDGYETKGPFDIHPFFMRGY